MLCRRALQVFLLVQSACFIIVVQGNVQLEVTELTSSLTASKRNFPCPNEEFVYRCVTKSKTMDQFQTIWTWNNTEQVGSFHSNYTIGEDNTCNSDDKLTFLHSTLVYANTTTCVSLLIVTPSLPNYEDVSVPIECAARTMEPHILRNWTIVHNTVSGTPKWGIGAKDNMTLNCSTFNDKTFLLNISWPGIINDQDMDFDYYTISLRIAGENNVTIYNFTGETTTTCYENIIFHVESPEVANNLTAQIAISAINKCKNINILSVERHLNKESDNCSNYRLIPAPTDTNSSSKPTYITVNLVAGLLISTTSIVLGRSS